MDSFLGETFQYWMELRARANELGVGYLLRDLADLSAKVSYYETQITRMYDFKDAVEKR